MRGFLIGLSLLIGLVGCAAPRLVDEMPVGRGPEVRVSVDFSVCFRNDEALREHYSKHGQEFGEITRAEYLFMAQELRDTEADGKSVLVAYRPDGIVSKYDRRDGEFLAYNRNKVIRTFFKPGDGERYFNRQRGR
ncbi:MAG: hypothetical protein ACKVQS_09490 [Fimbriimonadaceae bacterium]